MLTLNGFIDSAYKRSRKPKQLSQRSKNIVTLQECRPKSQGVRGAGVWPSTPRERSWFLALVWTKTIRMYNSPFHGFLMTCQKRAKIQPATLGMLTDKYLVLSYMVGTQITAPPPHPQPLNKKAGKNVTPSCLVGAKGEGEGVKNEKAPEGHLGIFLGGYVPPGTPNWHPVLKKISP